MKVTFSNNSQNFHKMQFFQPIWFYTTVSPFLLCFTSLYYICQHKASFNRVFKIAHNLKYYTKDTIFSNMNSLELRYKDKGKILALLTVPIIFQQEVLCRTAQWLFNWCVVHQRGTAFEYCLSILLAAPFTAPSIFPANKK